MDERRYKETSQSLNPLPCPFEKAILSRRWCCWRSRRINIAEREVVGCTEEEACRRCRDYLHLLLEKARFALKHAPNEELPHGKAIRLQMGGLEALQADLGGNDIDILLSSALEHYGGLESLPFETLIQGVARYRGRRKAR